MNKLQLIQYLDTYLSTDQYTFDSSKNGLQVDNELDEVSVIGYAVDSTEYIIDKAIASGVTFMIVHHGLYRGIETPLTDVMYKRVKKLMDHNIAVYTSHLPLDAHSEVGNNIGLLQGRKRLFGIQEAEQVHFAHYKGTSIGFGLKHKEPVSVATLHTPYCSTLGLRNQFYNFGKHEYIKSVAFCSGQAGFNAILEASKAGYDLLITGEAVHYEITLAKELGLSLLLGGHYETEKIGPKLLAHHIGKEHELQTVYLDECY